MIIKKKFFLLIAFVAASNTKVLVSNHLLFPMAVGASTGAAAAIVDAISGSVPISYNVMSTVIRDENGNVVYSSDLFPNERVISLAGWGTAWLTRVVLVEKYARPARWLAFGTAWVSYGLMSNTIQSIKDTFGRKD